MVSKYCGADTLNLGILKVYSPDRDVYLVLSRDNGRQENDSSIASWRPLSRDRSNL